MTNTKRNATAGYAAYRRLSWTSDNDECENACGVIMSARRYIEGDLGHYCSAACLDANESGGESDASDRAHERRQMGICD